MSSMKLARSSPNSAVPEGTYPGFASSGEGVAVNEDTHTVYAGHYPGYVDAFVQNREHHHSRCHHRWRERHPHHGDGQRRSEPDVANAGTPDHDSANSNTGTEPNNLSSSKPCDGSSPFNGQVQATISSGLTTGTTYYYRLTAANEAHPGVFSKGLIQPSSRQVRRR